MAIDLNDEILQDFLVEAGEILEKLNEELVVLEQTPEDTDLLNSIFRGFHTIKGGAGFLALDAMVGVCHVSEDVFNVLRNAERVADAALMDVILEAVDVINDMFEKVRSGIDPEPASDQLIARISEFKFPAGEAPVVVDGPGVAEVSVSEPVEAVAEIAVATSEVSDLVEQEFEAMLKEATSTTEAAPKQASTTLDEITEDEFDALLDELHGKGKGPTIPDLLPPSAATPPVSGDITDDEFDALLDDLHGKGKGPTAVVTPALVSEDITDDEFDKVLDELHGKGKGPTVAPPSPAKKEPEPEPAKPVVNKEPSAPAKKPAAKAKAAKSVPQTETSVRVDTQRLDDMMNLVGELVLVRNRLATLRSDNEDEEMVKAISNLDLVTSDLQLAVMKTRMQPIKKVFGRFPRVVRDLARNLGKKINLEMIGEETDLDKNLVEALSDPLVHLVRNSVDHGIEIPEERLAVNKPEEGTVTLSASQEGDHILLTITDDGKGMDADVLRKSAVIKGMMDEEAASRLSDIECYNLIFAPGFSTKTEISDVSGRGVGMDVVKTRITSMNGTVSVDSELGRGSTIIIKVPLTLAIMPTLMVELSDQAFALPLSNVVEILSLDLSKTNKVNGQLVVMVRGKALPLYNLNKWLTKNYIPDEGPVKAQHVVVIALGHQHIGFIVDHLLGQEEVVIKPLGAMLTQVKGLAGATITGDGGIALILDVPSLMTRYA